MADLTYNQIAKIKVFGIGGAGSNAVNRMVQEGVQGVEFYVANTDLQAVFRLILSTAVRNRVRQEELPETLYIISDMEFDSCARGADVTNFEDAVRLYRRYGYRLPRVVFWNVQSRSRQQPVRSNEQGVALVSGCTPRIFSQVMSGDMDPYSNMMSVIGGERYEKIRAA